MLLGLKVYVRVPQYHGLQIDTDRIRHTYMYNTSAARGEDVEQLLEHGEAGRRCETDLLAQTLTIISPERIVNIEQCTELNAFEIAPYRTCKRCIQCLLQCSHFY